MALYKTQLAAPLPQIEKMFRFAKIFLLTLCLSFSTSYRRSFGDENLLKSEIQKYATNDCQPDESREDVRQRGRHHQDKHRSKNFGLDLSRGGYFDQFDSESSEESEYHPNPYLYIGDRNVGYEGAFGDNMEGYIPQDMRNARKTSGKSFQNRYSYNRPGSLRPYNIDVSCVSQCIFNNMEIMEENGVPSETLFMKWAQDKIKNDRKRISALKEIRRCFLTASNSVKEDGCEFSKYLSECLNLGLDNDYMK